MAINIQEILHPSDSNQIKWEKVNYNFDQILANGGGPVGQKGQRGTQGSVGQTGAKGEKGEQGVKGESGSTSSRWETITIDADSNGIAEYVILKPKLESDTYHPVIFLGDQTFDNANGDDGLTNLRSTLTIGKHAQGGDSPSDEYLAFWHGERPESGNNIAIALSSNPNDQSEIDDDGNPFTRFTLAELYGTSNAETIELNIALDKVALGKLGSASDIYFAGAEAAFVLPPTNRAINTIKPGSIRYFGNQFQGAILDSNNNLVWTPFCMSPCGGGGFTGTIALDDNSDLNVAWDGSLLNASIEIQDDSDINVDVDGNPWNGPTTTTTTTSTTTTTTTASPQTINIAQSGYDPANPFTHVGGDVNYPVYIRYEMSPSQLLLTTDDVASPSWVTITSTSGGANNDRVLFIVEENNTGSARSGVITVTHPGNGNSTDSISISQSAAPTTTTTTTSTTTTSTTTTTQAPPSYDAISANPSGTINEGQNVTITVTGTNIPNGNRVWVNFDAGSSDQLDLTNGWSSGAGAGDSPATSGSYGTWVTMNNSVGTHTLLVKEDNLLEGMETIIFRLHSPDDGGIAIPGTIQKISTIADTSYPQTYNVNYIVGGYTDQYGLCQSNSNIQTVSYDAPTSGLATWDTVRAAIRTHAGNSISNGIWYKVVSSNEPGFTFGDSIINGGYDTTPSALQACSGVTSTTTTTTTVDSSSGSGCNQYWVGNSSSQYISFYCPTCGCDGGSVSINGVVNSYAQNSNNTFCSSLSASQLGSYLQGTGSGWIGTGGSITGACVPGSNYPGAN